MSRFSFMHALSLRGRERRGLNGFAGKPFHPPLTDVPVAAYLLAAVFDAASFVGHEQSWAHDMFRAASFVLIGGAAVSVFTALTGFLDWRTTERGSEVRRAANAHGITMVAVTVIVLTDIALRVFTAWDEPATTGVLVSLSVAAGLLVTLGAAIGGSLVFDYGFNVENSGDLPAWHADPKPQRLKRSA